MGCVCVCYSKMFVAAIYLCMRDVSGDEGVKGISDEVGCLSANYHYRQDI